MKNLIKLFNAEIYKFLKRRDNWLLFASIPILVFLSVHMFKKSNLSLERNNTGFVNSLNFPYQIIQEQLILAVNILILYYVTNFIIQELKNGEARFVFTRGVSKFQFIQSKIIIISLALLLFYILIFIFSLLFGKLFLPYGNCIYKFFTEEKLVGLDAYKYAIKYYVIAYLSSLTMLMFLTLLGVFCKNSNIAFAVGLAVVIISLIYPEIIAMISASKVVFYIQLTSIVFIQFKGIALFLSQPGFNIIIWICLIYIGLSLFLLMLFCKNNDYTY